MPSMTPEQIARARRSKKIYLISFLVALCANGLNLLAGNVQQDHPALFLASLALAMATAVFFVFATWGLCRSIQIGIAPTLAFCVLSPILFIVALVVLNRLYAKRTGLKLTMFMGDKEPRSKAA